MSPGVVLVFLFFLFLCWFNSASWPLQEIRLNLTLPVSRAPRCKSDRGGLA